MSDVYYNGCWDEPGHYLHDQTGHILWEGVGPFTRNGIPLDGYFPPATCGSNGRQMPGYQDDTLASLTHVKGWTVLAMWDRSIDSRYGCNAAFLAEGQLTHAEMWALAKEAYPKIVARLKAAPESQP